MLNELVWLLLELFWSVDPLGELQETVKVCVPVVNVELGKEIVSTPPCPR